MINVNVKTIQKVIDHYVIRSANVSGAGSHLARKTFSMINPFATHGGNILRQITVDDMLIVFTIIALIILIFYLEEKKQELDDQKTLTYQLPSRLPLISIK